MFKLTMYPATDGDCLLLTWGDQQKTSNAIIDLGRGATWRAVKSSFATLNNIELFTITHVDSDHVAGAAAMALEEQPPFAPRRVWFNALQQLERAMNRSKFEPFSAKEGEKLSRAIADFHWPRNVEFESRVVSTNSPEADGWMDFGGGLRLLLLSPDDKSLAEMIPKWELELAKANIRPFDPDVEDDAEDGPAFEEFGGVPDVEALARVPFVADDSESNGTSVAFVAEFNGKRVMLTGDSSSEVIERRLRPFADAEGGRFRVDLLKVAHHGSRNNSSANFYKMLNCQRFAFSTDGSRRHGHPHHETIARILFNDPDREKTLYFNYDGPHSKVWKNDLLKGQWNYRTEFPDAANNGTIAITVEA
jgi:beta-lactamase superfamily II metal-dependent hydrolase